jgi:Protein of unknown function (DUF3592)
VIPLEGRSFWWSQIRVATALRWIGVLVLLFFAVPLALIAGFLAWRQYRILKTWPAVDAQVIRAVAVPRPGSPRQPQEGYAAEFVFRYELGGHTYEATATPVYSSSLPEVQRWLGQLPVGSHRAVRYDPDNARIISLAVDYRSLSFVAPYRLGRSALSLMAFAVALIAVGSWAGTSAGRKPGQSC